jgi:hypothetical protein
MIKPPFLLLRRRRYRLDRFMRIAWGVFKITGNPIFALRAAWAGSK